MVSDSQADRGAPTTYLADQFSDTIDAVYQHALHENPSLQNQVAYAGYLASHGRPDEGLGQFKRIIQNDALAAQPALLHEIGERILQIETRLENDPARLQPFHHG
jgi:hypothetical protein